MKTSKFTNSNISWWFHKVLRDMSYLPRRITKGVIMLGHLLLELQFLVPLGTISSPFGCFLKYSTIQCSKSVIKHLYWYALVSEIYQLSMYQTSRSVPFGYGPDFSFKYNYMVWSVIVEALQTVSSELVWESTTRLTLNSKLYQYFLSPTSLLA